MTLYVDLLFFLNLFVNYLLLRLTGFAVSRRPRLWRLLAAAAVGALGAFYILLPVKVVPALSVVVEFFYKLLLCGAITLICFGFGSLRRFLKAASAFLLLSFALAGILLCGMLLFRPAGMLVSGSAVYFQISPLVLVISTIVCYLLLRLLERLSARIRMSGHHYQVTIVLNGRRVDGGASCPRCRRKAARCFPAGNWRPVPPAACRDFGLYCIMRWARNMGFCRRSGRIICC